MNFVKTFLASLLAVFVGVGLVFLFWIFALVGMVSAIGSSPKALVGSGSVLRLDFGVVSDSPQRDPLSSFDLISMSSPGHTPLMKTIRAIRAAAEDPRIEGLYLNFGTEANVSLASLEELRRELELFKESNKFVVAYQEHWGQLGYWFASVADSVFANPAGGVEWTGLAANVMFYKGLLDKLDIEPVVVRHGKFKSAVEPFLLDKMSDENRRQYEKMVLSMWGMVVSGVSASRAIPEADLQAHADHLAIDSPAAAVEKGLLDGLKYEDEVMDLMAALCDGSVGSDESEVERKAPKIVSLKDYISQLPAGKMTSKNKIAIIYAEGDIVSGEGGSGEVGSESMIKKIRKAREDKGVKAVVLRINSPGGSALASEVMWRELELLRAEKPLVVSMGAMAASGGYYIAAPADAILADRATLTGSIGVFGLFANVGDAMKNKLGVTTDVVRTNKHSDLGSIYRRPTAPEVAYFQKSVEEVYGTFVGHVSEGRNMTPEAVDAIGQGRVWAGQDALEIGLIDGYGGLMDALALAADRVGVADDFRVWEVMDEPTPLAALMQGLSARLVRTAVADEIVDTYEYLRDVTDGDRIQARLPVTVEVR